MTRRSVRDALEVLDRLPFNNSTEERDARDYAQRVRDERIERLALQTIRGSASDIAGMRDRHAAELEVIETGFAELAKALQDGDLDAAQAGRRWTDLRTRRRALVKRSAGLVERAADTAARAEAPDEYLHSLESRFPSTQHEWPW